MLKVFLLITGENQQMALINKFKDKTIILVERVNNINLDLAQVKALFESKYLTS